MIEPFAFLASNRRAPLLSHKVSSGILNRETAFLDFYRQFTTTTQESPPNKDFPASPYPEFSPEFSDGEVSSGMQPLELLRQDLEQSYQRIERALQKSHNSEEKLPDEKQSPPLENDRAAPGQKSENIRDARQKVAGQTPHTGEQGQKTASQAQKTGEQGQKINSQAGSRNVPDLPAKLLAIGQTEKSPTLAEKKLQQKELQAKQSATDRNPTGNREKSEPKIQIVDQRTQPKQEAKPDVQNASKQDIRDVGNEAPAAKVLRAPITKQAPAQIPSEKPQPLAGVLEARPVAAPQQHEAPEKYEYTPPPAHGIPKSLVSQDKADTSKILGRLARGPNQSSEGTPSIQIDSANTGRQSAGSDWGQNFGDDSTRDLGQPNSSSSNGSGTLRSLAQQMAQRLQESPLAQNLRQLQFRLLDQNRGEIRLRLHPENLGQVRIHLSLNGSQLSGRIVANSNEAARILQDNMQHLEASLRDGGFENQGLNVSVSGGQTGNSGFQNTDGFAGQNPSVLVAHSEEPSLDNASLIREPSQIDYRV